MINDFSDVIILETLKISELEPRNVPGIETNWDVDICGCMRSFNWNSGFKTQRAKSSISLGWLSKVE